jgi:16S rRNA (cytosine967-C5)-methyltransferase
MRFHSYVNSAVRILNQYEGEEPFTIFLKKYFSANKKHGSKDRKEIGHLCYCYLRLGKALLQVPVEERILTGLFLCSNESNEILANLRPEWDKQIGLPLQAKLSAIHHSLLLTDIFPWHQELSEGIDHEKFCQSFLVQPDLFVRIRPGYENTVKEKLRKAGIDFKELNLSCLSLLNSSKIEDVIELDKEAVIQDYNSQQIGKYLQLPPDSHRDAACRFPIRAWDCCAGSGGKSLLLHDVVPNVALTVSDVRESILVNLRKRFLKAGITKYRSFITDLTKSQSGVRATHDLIICDAPCTGSGTWNRTPEQLVFFDERKIESYAALQKQIVSHVIPRLLPQGLFVYITCSVFKMENEEIVSFIDKSHALELIETHRLEGYDKKADTMFVALLRGSL